MTDQEYWKKALEGFEYAAFPDLTGLSAKGRSERSLEGSSKTEHKLEVKLDAIVAQAKQLEVSLLSLLQAAWAKVLVVYVGEYDLCFGCINGKSQHPLMLPCRVAVKPSATHKEVVQNCFKTWEDAKTHGAPDADTLKSILDSGDSKLYDTVLLLDNKGTDSTKFTDMSVILDIATNNHENQIVVTLHCHRSLVLEHDIPLILATFETALRSMISESQSSVVSWAKDRPSSEKSVCNWDYETAISSDNELVHTAFERHARDTPDKLALDFLNQDGSRTKWTFKDMNTIANAIASVLVKKYKVQVEQPIPICTPRSSAFYACVLAVLKCGGVFTPFSGSPEDRKKYMLDELKARVVLTVDNEDMSWCETAEVFNVSSFVESGDNEEHDQSFTAPTALKNSNLAYQMYTSGKPKAVSIEHRNAMQTAAASRDLVPWDSESRLLQHAAPSFDMCYYDIFLSWNLGICLSSADNATMYNDLTDVISKLDATLIGLTPSVALTLDPAKVDSIKWMYCIGEAMPQPLVDAWEGRLVNSWGPTEGAQMNTIFDVDKNVKSAIIGKPFKCTSFIVLQKNSDSIAPTMGLGELCIGGLQIARGYYNNEEKTKQAFFEHNGQRMYRTGDNVRMLSDGNFEFVGRVDDQVKIRGQRVELGEINKTLQDASKTLVGASCQILKMNDRSKEQLVAFLVRDKSSSEDEGSIQKTLIAYAQERLPGYMVPKFFLFVEKIPLSASGKVDKKALTKIFRESGPDSNVASENSTSSPATGIVKTLQEVFAKASGSDVNEINLDVSIYQLGLDSISAMQMASELKRRGIKVTATDILNNPTVNELASTLKDQSATPQEEQVPLFDFAAYDDKHREVILKECGVSGVNVVSIKPTTPLQAGMIAQSINSSGKTYFNRTTHSIPKDFDKQRFNDAWSALLDKHEVLRSGFFRVKDSQFPLAMITYTTRSIEMPVEISDEDEFHLDIWSSSKVEECMQRLHLPPWRVIVQGDSMHVIMHHALYDEQVLKLIFRDLGLAYEGRRVPTAPSALEQHSSMLQATTQDDTSTSDFWRQVCDNVAINRFPIMTSLVQTTQDCGKATMTSKLSLSDIDAGCRKNGVTMQAVGQAAWASLLSAIIGEPTATFGTVLSGRLADDSDEISFPCITTVPIMVNARQEKQQLLNQIMKFNADVQKYQFTPLKQIQRWTGHPDEALFDTMFVFQRRPGDDSKDPDLFTMKDDDLKIEYPVSVEIEPKHNTLEFRIYHRLDRVPNEQAQLMVEQLDYLFTELIRDDNKLGHTSISEADPKLFSLLSPEVDTLPTDVSFLHEFVEQSAKSQPDKPAFEFVSELHGLDKAEMTSWTFKELDEAGNRMAHLLKDQGVEQGKLVAICFDKCPEASFAMLGILKAGCGFLALDPGAPLDRKKFIAEDSKAAAVVSMGDLAEELRSNTESRIIDLTQVDYKKYPSHAVELGRAIDGEDISYCLYTSGTTGTPKGCLITHTNVVQALLNFQKLLKWTDESRWLEFASYHFDVSVLEQYWTWSIGCCCVAAPRDLILEDLPATLNRLNISHIDLTPSLARVLNPEDVPTLAKGVFVTGGEMLKKEIIELWGESGALHNFFGPTEATIGCTAYCGVPKNGRPTNIGPQFPTVGSFVVDPEDPTKPVLRGAVGELCVYGNLVAQGYQARPELTQERFIELDGKRAYRTGDLVRVLHDGCFDMLGRADSQVKLRGQRLEVDEINSVMKQKDSEVADAVTLVLKHPKQQKEQLVSFVVLGGESKKDQDVAFAFDDKSTSKVSTLRSACQEKLPGYMVPTTILPINRLPLTANNKVDEKKLKALYESSDLDKMQSGAGDVDSSASDAHASEEDMDKITAILADELDTGKGEIDSNASFFELGLDSISAIGFAKSLKSAGYKAASTAAIMTNPTVSRLALHLTGPSKDKASSGSDSGVQASEQMISAFQHRYKAHAAKVLQVKSTDVESLAPATPLQAGMIARSQESDKALYYASFSFNLHSDIDIDKLRSACQRVVDHTQILRTSFVSTDEGFAQVVLKSVEVPWLQEEVSEDDVDKVLDNKLEEWADRNESQISRPFEIVVLETPKTKVLTLHLFHACYDGNSLPLIMQAVLGEYHDAKDVSYGPSYHKALAHGPLKQIKDAQSFWTGHLAALKQLERRPFGKLAAEGAKHDTSVSRTIDQIEGFEDFRRKLSVTHQAVLQACWSAVLEDAMKAPLVMGIVVSGRSIEFEGAEEVIGPLFNTIPFLLHIQPKDSWNDVLQRCHTFNSQALPFQHTPLRDIQKWARKIKNSDVPLFESLFVFQKRGPSGEDYEPIWTTRSDTFEADYPLAFEAEMLEDGKINLTLVTQAQISDEKASNGLLERFEHVLRKVIENAEAPLDEDLNMQAIAFELDEESQSAGMNGHSNGQNGTQSNGSDDIKWTTETTKIRDEIAKLAEVDASELKASTSILELGLDSIDAVKLSSRLKRVAKVALPVSQVMKLLTIGKIAAAATAGSENGAEVEEEQGFDLQNEKQLLKEHFTKHAEDMSAVQDILPCTPLQEGMVVDMLNSDYKQYLNSDVLQLSDDTDLEKLKNAWQKVVDATPILRSRFVTVESTELDCAVAQVVLNPQPVSWTSKTIDGDDRFDGVIEEVRKDVVESGPQGAPFRLTFLKSKKARYIILTLSHAMYDGWSLGLIHEDVNMAYKGEFSARPSFDPVLTKILSSSNNAAKDFWQQTLHDTTPTIFPAQEKGASQDQQVNVHRKEAPASASVSDLQGFAKKAGVTISAIAQAAYSCVLAQYTHQLDVAYAQVLSGRNDEDANEVCFPTMNTIISRAVLHGSCEEMVRYVQEQMGQYTEFQHYPLRKALAAAKGRSGEDVFDTLFIFQRRPDVDDNEESGAKALYESVGGASDVEYPVCVEAEVVGNELIWRVACKSSHVDEAGAEELLNRLSSVLSAIIKDPKAELVQFKDGKAGICCLAPVKVREGNKKASEDSQESGESAEENSDWSPEEQKLRKVIAQIARVDENEVRKTSSLADLGLDSILAIKVSSLLKKEGLKLTSSQLVRAGSVAEMARQLGGGASQKPAAHGTASSKTQSDDAGDDKKTSDTSTQDLEKMMSKFDKKSLFQSVHCEPEDVEDVLPATAGQVFMLSRWKSTGMYFHTLRFNITSCKSIGHLQTAWQTLVEQTPVLRTVFTDTTEPDLPIVQIVLKSAKSSVVEVPETADLDKEIRQHSAKSDDKQALPYVVLAQRQHNGSFSLRLRMSHALYDASSLPILVSHVEALLNDPKHSISQSSKFASHLSATRTSSAVKEAQDFWSSYLSDLKLASSARTSQSERKDKDRRIHLIHPSVIPANLNVASIAQKERISIHALILATYALAYATASRAGNGHAKSSSDQKHDNDSDNDILIGVYIANRSASTEDLTEPTLNFLPLRVRSPGSKSLVDVAKAVQKDLAAIQERPERDGAGLWEIGEWLGNGQGWQVPKGFVNVLSEGAEAEEDTNTNGETGKVRVIPAPESGDMKDGEEVLKFEDVETPTRLEGCGVYLAKGKDVIEDGELKQMFEVEVAVRADGGLNMGIVVPESVMGVEEARGLLGDMKGRLEEFCEGK